jgi:dipeptidyl aminopeptidase/acylaminoacyl peptidase
MHKFRTVAAVLAVLLAVASVVPAVAQAQAAPKAVKQYTIEQFMNTLRIGGSSFSPDESQVAYHSNKTGIFNVYVVPVKGGEAKQLTNSTKESIFTIGFSPTDGRLFYTYDRGGNENNHIYVQENGQERDLTPGEKVKAQFYGWSQDGKAFYYGTNERDPRFFDVFKMTLADFKSTKLFENTAGVEFGGISNDEKYMALVKPGATTADSDIWLYDVAAKKLKNITEHTGNMQNSVGDFDPESKSLYYTTDDGSEFAYVAKYDLATGKKETVEKANWDIMYTYFSHNGKYRVTGTNEDARTKIIVYDTKTGKPVELPKMPAGDITGINIARSEKKMAFYVNGDTSPPNLYIYDFGTKQIAKLTDSMNPAIDQSVLAEGEVVRYKSFDGQMIPAILLKPHQASATNKAPAIVQVHGGPGGQARKGYSALYQYLVNHGYAVLMVNNRGSSGYGKTFFVADDGKHGREPLWDVTAAKRYLASLPWVDGERIGILGGSYGGYMVLAALAFQPDVFDVGVDIFGVSNWLRTLESIPPYWESFRKALYTEIGDPTTQREMLREISPLFHAEKIKRPLIVLQGANDPRVIKPESDDIVAAVKKNGVPVEYVVFDNEGHGFTKKANEIRGYEAIKAFLDQHLKGKGKAQASK